MLCKTPKFYLLALSVASVFASFTVEASTRLCKGQLNKQGDGSECFRNFASDPNACPIVNVAFFKDAKCSQPVPLPRRGSFVRGNAEMLFESAVSHSVQGGFGSIRVLAAVEGLGIGFAKGEESDTVVQNFAWMSAEKTWTAYRSQACISVPNLDVTKVGVWTTKAEGALNQGGYVWNEDNIPLKWGSPQCHKQLQGRSGGKAAQEVCLEGASWGGGGMLLLYTNDDCTVDPKNSNSVKKQLYNTAQCTPLTMTEFRSFKAVQPLGPTIDINFSPIYYDMGKQGYHACSQRGVVTKPFKSGVCQKIAADGMFVGVYGNDPQFPQAGPSPGDKILRQGRKSSGSSKVAGH